VARILTNMAEQMLAYAIKRVGAGVVTLLSALTAVFFLVRVVPGDPALVVLGDNATAEALALMRARLGIEQPLPIQYLAFLRDIGSGSLGNSLVTGRRVLDEIMRVMPYTLSLTLAGLLIGVLVGIPLGMVAVRWRGRLPDHCIRVFSVASISLPPFVSGILLLLILAIQWRWFPVIHTEAPDAWTGFRELVLPAVNVGLLMVAYVAPVARTALLAVLSEDYIRTARAKGIQAKAVIWRHALRNALVPVVTLVGLYLGILIGNSVLTEIIFTRPGLGNLMVGALDQRDYPMLQGLMVVFAFAIVTANLLTDLVNMMIDPRMRAGRV
jgi:ABC-type dipeptide/oligopeptide/nickel transport system permease component